MRTEVSELSTEHSGEIFRVINAAARRYEGLIPEAADTDPYMSMEELEEDMDTVEFYGVVDDELLGVIGLQERADVSLVRHLYVRPGSQREGIGTTLLTAGIERAGSETVLVGTWKAAGWAIGFYEQHGFENLGTDTDLLSRYWDVPRHQREASVVLRYRRE